MSRGAEGQRIRVRRKRQNGYAQIPYSVIRDSDLSDKALRMWLVLESYADWDDDTCYPSMTTLADHMGTTRQTIHRAQKELVERGLLEVESGQEAGTSNLYTVVDPPGGCNTSVTGGVTPALQGGVTPALHKQEPTEQEPTNDMVTPDWATFDKFWGIYPRRVGKKAARRAWDKAIRDTEAAKIIHGAARYRDDPRRTPEYTAHPSTWLNAGRWDDEIEPPAGPRLFGEDTSWMARNQGATT